jgi:hypothetical protein
LPLCPKSKKRLIRCFADWSKADVFTSLAALNAIDPLGDRAGSLHATLHELSAHASAPDPRYEGYIPRLLTFLKQRFGD